MLDSLMKLFHLTAPRTLPTDEIPWSVLTAELVIAVLLLVLTFLLRKRFLKTLCLCGTVTCLFLACKTVFGSESAVTEIMRWLTAAAACILTVSIVNRINWSDVRGKSGKPN